MAISRARRSTDAIERLYISMRHLFHRGVYRVSGNPGKILRNLLFELEPEIYGSMTDPNKVELSGLMYVLDRLPEGIVETPFISFTADEGYDRSIFTPIIPAKRRRFCYRIDDDQMNIEISRGRSDIFDVLTHLTFLYNEADKIRNHAFDNQTLTKSRLWEIIEEIVLTKKELSRKEREVAIMHLSSILGRTFEETQATHEYFGTTDDPDKFFSIIYWMGMTSQADRIGVKKREITFTSTLRESIGHHVIGEKWANEIKRQLFKNGLQDKNIHIISANMHSVSNMLYAYDGLKRKYKADSVEIYEDLSAANNKLLRAELLDYVKKQGLIYIKDQSGTNIDVQIIDLSKVDLKNTAFSYAKAKDNEVIIVMDYAFGEQAFEAMDELLKPYKKPEANFKMNVKSVSIMGKAGILEGVKGDIMIATSHVFEGTTDNYFFDNELTAEDFKDSGLGVYEGPMISVLGTSLQNKDILEYFKNSSFQAVGLEMEGAHYHKAIQVASKIRHHIDKDVKVMYAYYASDNPLETGSTLASGGLGLTGVKPTYLITQKILEKIIK
ncbi:DUF6909 family protein [Faecalibacter bovis]|uniref:Uncharacterized protein n=1 Tax=Faecalibacter bovis TaxID=2898187 RepID=A0ABX7XEY1_9FLAO|nr:hypothetical protein [Faecalibacter bovis]QTV06522.1 hypothetical protein J9309_04140 [Faecalibacter bovis]